MRITSLPSYIKANELRPKVLKNCTVVIDGQNFLYDVYEKSKLNFELGCETDRLVKHMKACLSMFGKANVKCYFVFKGGDQNIERKVKTRIEGAFNAETFDFFLNNQFVPPILMKDAYKQILDEMAIAYTICEFECKRECVALAEKLKCPVISNDIEFCFLQAPYIDSSTMSYNNSQRAIQCKQYELNNFLTKHSLTKDKLAVFVVLTDLNIFPMNFFSKLLESLNIRSKNLHDIYVSLWKWLAKVEKQKAIDTIKQSLEEDDKVKFMNEICTVIDFMQLKGESYVVDYFLGNRNIIVKPADPNWFKKGVVCKRIAIPYINLYHANYWIESLGIETIGSEPSQLVAVDIVKYAYNLLTNFKRHEFKLILVSKKIPISAELSHIKTSGTHPFNSGWDSIKEKRYFEQFLTQNSIDVSLMSQVPSNAAMLIIALVYFARKKSVDVTKEVHAIIICYVLLGASGKFSKNENEQAAKATQSYFRTSKGELMRILDRDVLYRLAEFQHCLKQLNYLNTLCGEPFSPTVYHKTYNGTFVFKLYQDMAGSDNNTDNFSFINNVFKDSPSILNDVNMLIGFYDTLQTNNSQ